MMTKYVSKLLIFSMIILLPMVIAAAATALMEFLIKREENKNVELSLNYTYWAGKNLAPESAYVRDLYAKTDGLAGYLAVRAFMFGALLEKDWPYNSLATQPPNDAIKLNYRMKPIFIPRHKIDDFIQERQIPVVMNIMFYHKLFNNNGDATRLPSPAETTSCLKKNQDCGGHVVLLVGFDSDKQRFIFRNSWGTTWGNKGYGTLPLEYILQHCESCYHLKSIQNRAEDDPARQFVEKTVMGVSGEI
jgi:hypothetical protein